MKTSFYKILLLPLVVVACNAQNKGVEIKGELEHISANKVIIGRALNQAYDYIVPIDTIDVINGKFKAYFDTLAHGVYAFYPITDQNFNNDMVYVYIGEGKNEVDIEVNKYNYLTADFDGDKVVEQYEDFIEGLNKAAMQNKIDSLNNLFYNARTKGDASAMASIKEGSAEYYTQSRQNKNKYISDFLSQDRKDALGIYAYYTYVFNTSAFSTKDAIAGAREKINSFNEKAKQTYYYKTMLDLLSKAEKSVVGAQAPNIVGETPNGVTLSLNDLRGKYVLLDFWSSGCTWCRKETPNIQEVYKQFGGDKFTVLSVSVDVSKDAWIKAMEEDGMPWDNILLDKSAREALSTDYNVQGIPLILLISPDGTILYRDLRGDNIKQAVEAEVK